MSCPRAVYTAFCGTSIVYAFSILTVANGTLFSRRYKAILIDADSYWLLLSRYIHATCVFRPILNTHSD